MDVRVRTVFASFAVLAAQALVPTSGYALGEELQLHEQSFDTLQGCEERSVRSLIQTWAVQSQPPEEGGGEGEEGGEKEAEGGEGGEKEKEGGEGEGGEQTGNEEKGGKKGKKKGKKGGESEEKEGGEDEGNKTEDAGEGADGDNGTAGADGDSETAGDESEEKEKEGDAEENGKEEGEQDEEEKAEPEGKGNDDDESQTYVHIVPVVVPYPADSFQPDGSVKGFPVADSAEKPKAEDMPLSEETEAEIREKMKDATVAEEKELQKELEKVEKSGAARQIVFSVALAAALTYSMEF